MLPVVSGCLLLCLNQPSLMHGQPQSHVANALLLPCVGVALLLASLVFVKHLFSHGTAASAENALHVAGPVALVGVTVLGIWSYRLRKGLPDRMPIAMEAAFELNEQPSSIAGAP